MRRVSVFRNRRRTNVFRAAAGARIQEWILVREIVKAALGNDLENRQSLIAQNADRQFASGHEFFDEQFLDRIRAASARRVVDFASRFLTM